MEVKIYYGRVPKKYLYILERNIDTAAAKYLQNNTYQQLIDAIINQKLVGTYFHTYNNSLITAFPYQYLLNNLIWFDDNENERIIIDNDYFIEELCYTTFQNVLENSGIFNDIRY